MEETRKLVTLKEIDKITPIEGADRIECAHIGGWMVVVGKGEFYEGQRVFYFEPDSMLPLDIPCFSNLRPRGFRSVNGIDYHRLRTVKLRGQISQGLVLPFCAVNDIEADPDIQLELLNDVEENKDGNYTSLFRVIKWEDPILAKLGGKMKHFPEWITHTDEERIQNLPKLVDQLNKDDSFGEWYATEKIDGTSCTIWATVDNEGILSSGVCSRNYGLEEEEDNTYWKIAREKLINYEGELYSIIDYLRLKCVEEVRSMTGSPTPAYVIQGEIFGEGIQGNPLKIKGQRIAIFNLVISGNRILMPAVRSQFPELIEHWVPIHDELSLPHTLEEIVAQPDGIKSKINGAQPVQIEGLVWRNTDSNFVKIEKRKSIDQIDFSKIPEEKWELVRSSVEMPIEASFKAISNEYLAKQKD